MKPKKSKEDFLFHPELFGYRSDLVSFLAERGYSQFIEFQAIDVSHDTYGIEVTGIIDHNTALKIRDLSSDYFKDQMWIENPWNRCIDYDDGWAVEIFRDPDDQSDDWWKD